VILLLTTDARRLPHDPVILGVLVLSLVGAWLMTFFAMTIIGTLSFYMESSYSVFDAWLAGFMLLSGYLVPLDLFPSWLGRVAAVLPFRYMLAFPVGLVVGTTTRAHALFDLVVQWTYAGAIAAAAIGLFRLGLRRYTAFGG
jgi:ABC-2 type transport system permease protein